MLDAFDQNRGLQTAAAWRQGPSFADASAVSTADIDKVCRALLGAVDPVSALV